MYVKNLNLKTPLSQNMELSYWSRPLKILYIIYERPLIVTSVIHNFYVPLKSLDFKRFYFSSLKLNYVNMDMKINIVLFTRLCVYISSLLFIILIDIAQHFSENMNKNSSLVNLHSHKYFSCFLCRLKMTKLRKTDFYQAFSSFFPFWQWKFLCISI